MVGATGVSFDNEDRAFAVAAAWRTEVLPSVGNSFVVVLPTLLRRFIRDYDLGAYPSLTQKIGPTKLRKSAFGTTFVDAA